MIKRALLFLVLCCFYSQAFANLDFNSACIKAYKEIVCLRLGNARLLIDAEKRRNPENSVTILLDNYIDYFTVLTSESKADYERLKKNKSARLSLLAKEDKRSPYYLYAQAEINLQWALVDGLFEEYLDSSFEINKAYKLLKENARKFPAFLPNQKGLGLVNAVLGSLPEALKKTLSFVGIRGNTKNGVKILENLVSALPRSPYAHYYDEAVFCLSYVQTDILADYATYNQILANALRIDTSSLLRTYILTYSAMRTGHNEDAVGALARRPATREYQYFPRLDYLNGISRMYKLDPSAGRILLQFIQSYKGINGVKDAYLNLSWISLLKGDLAGYRENIDLLLSKGNEYYYKDKQAIKEANDPAPDPALLKARLLSDGGYYDKALAELDGKKAENFRILRDKIEYCYRLGRIYDEMGKDDIALKFYQLAVNIGRKERFAFASNGAMRMGNIYENRHDFPQAGNFYKQVLDMKDHDYEKDIENKAKEALRRIGNIATKR